ncbi:hypothetical protein BGW38_006457 [Lunasporangiospora selenospora]|uniref:NAD(P)-dependent dehydrogenase, short-chain alcohol dehydrogenase family n=1 Tax=Lunasporangiospora selenospora TaxID=979761 RepID=A0A9P6KH50_9FUNG|nr:hypothetical protein BGW38_006457 [Lunasporangiospora selenospora]
MTPQTNLPVRSAGPYIPSTVESQRGGQLFDHVCVYLSTSSRIPGRLVESGILLSEIFLLNIPEWLFGMRKEGRPPIEKRLASSIAASRMAIEQDVSAGERRKVVVQTGKSIAATEAGIRAVENIKVQSKNPNVEFIYLDLGSFQEIRKFSEEVNRRTNVVDLLVNNAGVMDVPTFKPTAEGHDSQFGINYLGHYFLTTLLLPLIKLAPKARIVMTASSAHYGTSKIGYKGITSAKAYDRINNYCGSKLATVMYTRFLAKTLRETHPNITVNCLHPGACRTNLFSSSWLLYTLTTIGFQVLLRPASRGARGLTYLCLSEEVEGISGEFWFDERIRQKNPASQDAKQQQELIDYSNKQIGF